MLDISKKYWVEFGPLCVLCSVESANVVIDLGQKGIQDLIDGLEIAEEAKNTMRNQIVCQSLPTATPGDLDSINMIRELEMIGYVVFYDVDEPIGHAIHEDEMELYVSPSTTLEEVRQERWKSIANSWERAGASRPEMPNYPEKKFGTEWFEWLPTKTEEEYNMSDFKKYRRTAIAEMRPYEEEEELPSSVSVSEADRKAGSPKVGDMIARNPKNHDDQWLVAKAYFKDNFEKI